MSRRKNALASSRTACISFRQISANQLAQQRKSHTFRDPYRPPEMSAAIQQGCGIRAPSVYLNHRQSKDLLSNRVEQVPVNQEPPIALSKIGIHRSGSPLRESDDEFHNLAESNRQHTGADGGTASQY